MNYVEDVFDLKGIYDIPPFSLAKQENRVMWSKYYHIDEKGTGENTAMAKLVSITLSGAIELMIQNKIPTGIQSSISDKNNIDYLFKILFENSIKIIHQ